MTLYRTPSAKVVISGEKLQRLLQEPNGFVAKDLIRRATNVQTAARRQVGKDTRTLVKSIVKRFVQRRGKGLEIYVGSSENYALLHHEGTVPHTIRPIKAKALRWTTVGGVRFAKVVNHPGTKPNRYLTDSLPEALK